MPYQSKIYNIVLAAAVFTAIVLLSPVLHAGTPSVPVKVKANVLFIYDSSRSLWGFHNGKPRAEFARSVLREVVQGLPQDASLGMIAFGHRNQDSCTDVETIAPIGSKKGQSIINIAKELRPKGKTSIAAALAQAPEAFKNVDGAKIIVLITDGGEECDEDPCAVTKKLAQSGLAVRVNTLGLNLSQREQEQLQCIAKAGSGRFFDVKDNQTMYKAISDIKAEVVSIANSSTTIQVAPPEDAGKAEGEFNLLLPAEGGKIISSGYTNWEKTITGNDTDSIWTFPDQAVVFGFKNNKPATFSKFAIAIPETLSQNVKEFELLVSSGQQYVSLGRFTTKNERGKSLYQEFTFDEVTARYFKFRVISNYGHATQGFGNVQIFQLKVIGNRR
jgi:hypothetical protein